MKRVLIWVIVSLVVFSVSVSASDSTDYVKLVNVKIDHENVSWASFRYEPRVTFEISMLNLLDASIAGLKLQVRFIDAFGDVLHTTEIFKWNKIIPSGQIVESAWSYKGEFMDVDIGTQGVYYKLRDPAAGGTLKAEVAIHAIAFDDGTIIEIEEPVFRKPSPFVDSEVETTELHELFDSITYLIPGSDADSAPKLSIRVDKVNGSLEVENGKWIPLPYPVTATIKNVGSTKASQVEVKWESPIGLELAAGENSRQPIGSLNPGQRVQVEWNIRPLDSPFHYGGNFPYSITATVAGQSEEFRAEGFLNVPFLESLIKIYVDPGNSGDVYVDDFFEVRVNVENVRSLHYMDVLIEYDPSTIELVGETRGLMPGVLLSSTTGIGQFPIELGWDPSILDTNDRIGVATLRIRGNRSSDEPLHLATGTLATLRFRALQTGTHTLKFKDVRIADGYGQSMNVVPQNGEVHVLE